MVGIVQKSVADLNSLVLSVRPRLKDQQIILTEDEFHRLKMIKRNLMYVASHVDPLIEKLEYHCDVEEATN